MLEIIGFARCERNLYQAACDGNPVPVESIADAVLKWRIHQVGCLNGVEFEGIPEAQQDRLNSVLMKANDAFVSADRFDLTNRYKNRCRVGAYPSERSEFGAG